METYSESTRGFTHQNNNYQQPDALTEGLHDVAATHTSLKTGFFFSLKRSLRRNSQATAEGTQRLLP